MCAVCKKHGLGIHDNIVCGNEDGTKGCERIFHLVGERGGASCVEVRGVDGRSRGRLVLSGLQKENAPFSSLFDRIMSVTECSREIGETLSKEDLLYTFEDVECMVNQNKTHSAGTLYLTQKWVQCV